MSRRSPDSKRVANPWVRVGVVCGILFAADFAFPGGMVDWLDEHNDGGWLSPPLAAARDVDSISSALGVKRFGQGLRRAFDNWVGADPS